MKRQTKANNEYRIIRLVGNIVGIRIAIRNNLIANSIITINNTVDKNLMESTALVYRIMPVCVLKIKKATAVIDMQYINSIASAGL